MLHHLLKLRALQRKSVGLLATKANLESKPIKLHAPSQILWTLPQQFNNQLMNNASSQGTGHNSQQYQRSGALGSAGVPPQNQRQRVKPQRKSRRPTAGTQQQRQDQQHQNIQGQGDHVTSGGGSYEQRQHNGNEFEQSRPQHQQQRRHNNRAQQDKGVQTTTSVKTVTHKSQAAGPGPGGGPKSKQQHNDKEDHSAGEDMIMMMKPSHSRGHVHSTRYRDMDPRETRHFMRQQKQYISEETSAAEEDGQEADRHRYKQSQGGPVHHRSMHQIHQRSRGGGASLAVHDEHQHPEAERRHKQGRSGYYPPAHQHDYSSEDYYAHYGDQQRQYMYPPAQKASYNHQQPPRYYYYYEESDSYQEYDMPMHRGHHMASRTMRHDYRYHHQMVHPQAQTRRPHAQAKEKRVRPPHYAEEEDHEESANSEDLAKKVGGYQSSTALTKQSRVLRRGRGRRVDDASSRTDLSIAEGATEEDLTAEPEEVEQSTSKKDQQFRVLQRSGGRGNRKLDKNMAQAAQRRADAEEDDEYYYKPSGMSSRQAVQDRFMDFEPDLTDYFQSQQYPQAQRKRPPADSYGAAHAAEDAFYQAERNYRRAAQNYGRRYEDSYMAVAPSNASMRQKLMRKEYPHEHEHMTQKTVGMAKHFGTSRKIERVAKQETEEELSESHEDSPTPPNIPQKKQPAKPASHAVHQEGLYTVTQQSSYKLRRRAHPKEQYYKEEEESEEQISPQRNHIKFVSGRQGGAVVISKRSAQADGSRHGQGRGRRGANPPIKHSSYDSQESSEEANDAAEQKKKDIDVYTPKVENQTSSQPVRILRPYHGFEQPLFYQGAQWRFVRQSTNQNSKQKHYDKGDYDEVQYNFPGAELEENNLTDGEQKLYPPIDDYSDEDIGGGMPPPSNLKAKISFQKSASSKGGAGPIATDPLNQMMQAPVSQGVSTTVAPSSPKNKKRPMLNQKQYISSDDEHQLPVATLDIFQPVTMDVAKKFFLQDTEEQASPGLGPGAAAADAFETYYEKYLTDGEAVKRGLEGPNGRLFEGVVRTSARLRQVRAYVTVPELNMDVLIEGYKNMNRAMDGDKVLVELAPVCQWLELGENAKKSAQLGEYTNETVVEKRVGLDYKTNTAAKEKEEEKQATVGNGTLDEKKRPPKQREASSGLQKPRPKKTMRTTDDEHEGYIASNSDNNLELTHHAKIKRERNGSNTQKSARCNSTTNDGDEPGKLLSDSSTELRDVSQLDGLQVKALDGQEDKKEDANAQQAQQPAGVDEKQSSLFRKELKGDRAEVIQQVNQLAQTLRPLGKIVALRDSPVRASKQLCTLVELSHGDKDPIVLAQPINSRLPAFQVDRAPADLLNDKRMDRDISHRYYVIEYTDWQINQRRPQCTVIESLGEGGNLRAETLRLLKQHEICTEEYEIDGGSQREFECLKVFTKDIDAQTGEWQIPEEELAKRLDLRDRRIFTVDPVTAKDLDDALSIDHIGGTIYEVGVHIADVSYFVPQGTDLDREALKRSTSTYLVHRVFPMLPRLLSETLCSLNPNVDRLAYSIFYRLDLATGELVPDHEPRITRSVIRSCAKWNYEMAQQILDDKIQSEDQIEEHLKPSGGHQFLELASDLLKLNQVAQARRKKRTAAGSLVFRNSDFQFTLNPETSYPIKYKESPSMASKQLVEEYMLLANVLVADFLHAKVGDKVILRAHDDLTDGKKLGLATFFQSVGLDMIDLTDSQTLGQSVENTLNAVQDAEERRVMAEVIHRKFVQAIPMGYYACPDIINQCRHYGLNFDRYTHFTSPIRRYPDLLIHRLLTICLAQQQVGPLDGLDYSEYVEDITEKSYNARKASRDCVTLFHCLLLKEHGSRVFDAIIFDIEGSWSVNVYVKELNLDLLLNFREDARIEAGLFNDEEMSLALTLRTPTALAAGIVGQPTTADSGKEAKSDEADKCFLHVFDKVQVKLSASDSFPLEIRSRLVLSREDAIEAEALIEASAKKQAELDKLI